MKVLNYKERISIVLYYSQQYTTKEIAKLLHTSENTIKSQLRRAKLKIKDYYERSNING